MPALACRLDATPAPGGFVGLAFMLTNSSDSTVSLTHLEPLSPSRLRAWVDGREVSVPKAQVAERRITPFTLMPNNFMDVIAEHDLQHLVSYLGTLR